MKDQELRDKFHAYRPQIDDNEAFMDKLMAQMDAVDEQQHARTIPFYRRILPWVAGIAACVFLVLTLYTQHSEQPNLKSHRLSQANEIPTWQYEDELMRADACLTHQMEIKEKGERLAAYIHQQTTIDIQY